VQHRRTRHRQQQFSLKVPLLIATLATGAVAGAILPIDSVSGLQGGLQDAVTAVGLSPSCNIKGNVSIDTGERIYHVPGQKYYSQTNIRPDYGERYFCSEDEARRAGWRRSRI